MSDYSLIIMTKKEIILNTALQRFSEQGYDRTPTSQIAQQAGVSEGLIFRHFGNKAGLLVAIIQEGMDHIATTMEAYSSATIEPREAIIQHIERALTAIREQEKFWKLVTKIRFQPEVHQVAGAQLVAVNQFVVQHLARNFQHLGVETPEQEALMLFAMIDGICLHWLNDTTHYPLDEMKNLLIKKYSHE